MTFARTGRSMKNLEIIAGSRRSDAPWSLFGSELMQFGRDLLPRNGAQDAADNHPVVLGQAAPDDPQFTNQLRRLDAALFDHIVFVDYKHIAPALIAADRDVRHQQGRLQLRGYAYAHEIAGQ